MILGEGDAENICDLCPVRKMKEGGQFLNILIREKLKGSWRK